MIDERRRGVQYCGKISMASDDRLMHLIEFHAILDALESYVGGPGHWLTAQGGSPGP